MASAIKTAEGLTRICQIGWLQTADGLDGIHLCQLVELVELAHALFGKGDLVHDLG